jgi:hypothetical protein
MKKSLIDTLLTFGHTIVINGVYRFLPDNLVDIMEYVTIFGHIPNLKNPVTFNEKLQWIKINGRLEQYKRYVDKLEVRSFIKKTIGNKYLVPLLGSWSTFEDIPLDNLPDRFVLKGTHGSGYVFVCKDKALLNLRTLKKDVNTWLHENFYKKTREIQYKYCEPRVMCERYLENESGGLPDYKLLCFHGKPKLVELVWDRFTDHKHEVFVSLDWKILSSVNSAIAKVLPKKPEKFNEMLHIAETLAKGFPFVRVDMYEVKNKIYFGELTFTPDNGLEKFDPPDLDYRLGKLLNIPGYLNKYDN